MSALVLEIQPIVPTATRVLPRRLQMAIVALAGALAPWLLLVTAYGGLTHSAASCFAGTLPT
jgi:hypothetical protein